MTYFYPFFWLSHFWDTVSQDLLLAKKWNDIGSVYSCGVISGIIILKKARCRTILIVITFCIRKGWKQEYAFTNIFKKKERKDKEKINKNDSL